MKNAKSLLFATAAAALFTSGQLLAAEEAATTATEAKIHCGGVNACKGTSECKSATNACKGQNKCAGQGWLSMTKDECDAKGGKALE